MRVFLYILIVVFYGNLQIIAFETNIEIFDNNVITVNSFSDLSKKDNNTIKNGDVAFVKGFRDENDGGGGIFIFDINSNLDPFFSNSQNNYLVGYSEYFDGIIVKPYNAHSKGRWIRQWDRGKLNIRWFGGSPEGINCSLAFNAALKYAQFDILKNNIFKDPSQTRAGKTIFIPTGRYYFKSELAPITHGVQIEGEGNFGSSVNGTLIYITFEYSDVVVDNKIAENEYGFFRFYANGTQNSGGGISKLSIKPLLFFNSNIISLIAPRDKNLINSDPAVTWWTGENLFIEMKGKALRAIYMKSYQEYGPLPWRIRDINLINCYFSGASKSGETIFASNVAILQIIGGFIFSGMGEMEEVIPGILLTGQHGCVNVMINGVLFTNNSVIKIDKAKDVFVSSLLNKRRNFEINNNEVENLKIVK